MATITIVHLIGILALLFSIAGAMGAVLYLMKLQPPRTHRDVQTFLILPATGKLEKLEGLLSALSVQTLLPARLVISVESTLDPAYSRAASLSEGYPFPIDLVVAGEAKACAQKCHNQIAALAWLRKSMLDETVIVLMDADILPDPGWLSSLATPIANDSADMVSGYRWQQPIDQRLGSQLVTAIDRGIALLPRPPGSYLPWGGSIALSQRALAQIDVEEVLNCTFTDDCVLGNAARDHGLRLLIRRALLVRTPASYSLMGVWRFGRRQYQIVRTYCPRFWYIGVSFLCVRVGGWASALIVFSSYFSWFVLAGLVMSSLVVRIVQQRISKLLGHPDITATKAIQVGMICLQPLVDVFHLGMVIAAYRTRRITWGHVTYDVRAPESVDVIARTPWPNPTDLRRTH